MRIDILEQIQELLVARKSKSAQERCNRNFALAVNLYVNDIVRVRFQLEPCAAVGNDFRSVVISAANNL